MTQRIWWHICIFFNAQTNAKKSKRATKPTHQDSSKMDRHSDIGRESTTGNSGFKKLAVQWLNQVQFSNQTFVVADSLRLRNRQLLKPAKRYHT
jgi:hypothetical protein